MVGEVKCEKSWGYSWEEEVYFTSSLIKLLKYENDVLIQSQKTFQLSHRLFLVHFFIGGIPALNLRVRFVVFGLGLVPLVGGTFSSPGCEQEAKL